MALLEVSEVHTHYGNIEALKGVSLEVEEGEVVTLIGSNGAGKSTTLRSISGLTPPREGSISFEGNEIGETPPQDITGMGISQSPEGRKCFSRMTVRENLELGAFLRRDDRIEKDLKRVFDLFPRLEERERQKAGTMSGGEQQMLAIGRGLMGNPRLLLVDEISLGLAPVVVRGLYRVLRTIAEEGTTTLVVDQDVSQIMALAQRIYCFRKGTVSLEGRPADLTRDRIAAAYFGV